MINQGLRNYILKLYKEGYEPADIFLSLTQLGFQKNEITECFRELGFGHKKNHRALLIGACLVMMFGTIATAAVTIPRQFQIGGATEPIQSVAEMTSAELASVQNLISEIDIEKVPEQIKIDQLEFLNAKEQYIKNETSFIEADLSAMKLKLYDEGQLVQTFDILSKGRENSWWETPTGHYLTESKTESIFSSIGHVFMPYSIQFYGNYFIHGWPYYSDGTPVAQNYSGGCIRMATDDARQIYEFAKRDMPILVLEEFKNQNYVDVGELVSANKNITEQSLRQIKNQISAKSFVVYDLAYNQVLLERGLDQRLPIASITKLMTALVAHEIYYLGREITMQEWMALPYDANTRAFMPKAGQSYLGLDLLYPLLMQSANQVANLIYNFTNKNHFIDRMNMKAESLDMNETVFADTSGISRENISSVADLAKLARHIYFKRPFIFDISKGIIVDNVGFIQIGQTIDLDELENFNEFHDDERLVGVKIGHTIAARGTLLSVWHLETSLGQSPVAIIVLGSNTRERDTERLLEWLEGAVGK